MTTRPSTRVSVRLARCLLALGVLAVAFGLTEPAAASGGGYVFDGGSKVERAQVHRALEISRFNWNLVQNTVTIHIRRGVLSHSIPGEIWLDADLLDAGEFSWATVQDEYAHQIDFSLFSDAIRIRLERALWVRAWCYENPAIQAHSAQGCELFSSVLPWAYWQSAANPYRPAFRLDESAAMPPAQFRRLLTTLLGPGTTSR